MIKVMICHLAPNLVLFPNPKILVLQNDFFSFISVKFIWKILSRKKKLDYMYLYIYFL